MLTQTLLSRQPRLHYLHGLHKLLLHVALTLKRFWPNIRPGPPTHLHPQNTKPLIIHSLRAEEMAVAISTEMGAPIDLARSSQAPCLPWHSQNFLKAFDSMQWLRPLGPHAPNDRIAMEPIGVVGLITPWNWPMNQVFNRRFRDRFVVLSARSR